MAELRTFPVPASGGLDLVSPTQILAQKAGFAAELENMEPLPEGGYRRINGYSLHGDIPDAFTGYEIRGIHVYQGLVVVVGDTILHMPDGATAFPVNLKDCKDKQSSDLTLLEKLPRLGNGPVEFSEIVVGGKDVLVITDSVSPPASLTISNGLYTYEVAADPVAGMVHTATYQDHIVVAGGDKGNKVALSARFSTTDFSGTGSWGFDVNDKVTGVHVFRDFLYVFCENSIFRVSNLESAANVAVRPVTTKIGCVDGRTIQEIGGDIIFLAHDGFRYLGATERIDDVSLSNISGLIRPVHEDIDYRYGIIGSIVIPSKAQYRLFYRDRSGDPKGIIGTLSTNGAFQWATTTNMDVKAITNGLVDGNYVSYHVGDGSGSSKVFHHDSGNSFDGASFVSKWTTPFFDMGDAFIRKTLHSALVYIESTELAEIQVNVKFDYESRDTMQPEPFYLSPRVPAARFGTAVFGEAIYGATRFPVEPLQLEGSGKTVSFTFTDSGDYNAPYIIRGFTLEFTAGGRV